MDSFSKCAHCLMTNTIFKGPKNIFSQLITICDEHTIICQSCNCFIYLTLNIYVCTAVCFLLTSLKWAGNNAMSHTSAHEWRFSNMWRLWGWLLMLLGRCYIWSDPTTKISGPFILWRQLFYGWLIYIRWTSHFGKKTNFCVINTNSLISVFFHRKLSRVQTDGSPAWKNAAHSFEWSQSSKATRTRGSSKTTQRHPAKKLNPV